MKYGLILEGGASRTIYTCGILDAFLDKDIHIDYIVGASAGVSYGVSYMSRQKERNLRITAEYMPDKRYMGARHLLNRKNHSYYNLDFVFFDIPEKLIPFDYDEYAKNGGNCIGAVTNIDTGKPEYLKVSATDREFTVLRASCALPILFQPIEIDGKFYMDGGISDSIPFRYALEEGGCDKVVVVLTRPRGYVKTPEKTAKLVKLLYPKYPKLAEALADRHNMYNRELSELYELEKQGKALIITPDKDYKIGRTERKSDILVPYYYAGRKNGEKDAERVIEFMREG